jgi:SAM-dependent methyltransferase
MEYKMSDEKLLKHWKGLKSTLKGWDFSSLNKKSDKAPWDFAQTVKSYLKPTDRLLDIMTGGGENLLKLGHPYELTSATEGYPPNIRLCQKKLLSLGIDVRPADIDGIGKLPFEDQAFEVITDRHGHIFPEEIIRLLKPGGLYITEQVGSEWYKTLHEVIDSSYAQDDYYLKDYVKKLEEAGLKIIEQHEALGKNKTARFFDIESIIVYLYWLNHTVNYDFSVETHFDALRAINKEIAEKGYFETEGHLFLIVAKK